VPELFPEKKVSVGLTQELIRISKLPRRSRSEKEVDELVVEMTELYRIVGGEMTLRPVQAEALLEIGTIGGAFGPISVGKGKTGISVLAPVANAERPLLVVPAKLIAKTERDRRTLARHFMAPEFLRVMSYEWLGRAQAAEALEKYQPDLIVGDEIHFLRNPRAAVTRRFRRYMQAHPETKFVALSGTITKRSIIDYAHLLFWCLKDQSPLPRNFNDLELWADALDERKGQTRRADPGYLEILCNEEEKEIWKYDRRAAARSAFRRRLVETPGVIATAQSDVDATLTIEAVEPPLSSVTEDAFKILRRDWKLPDGKTMMDGLEHARHARELSLGFFYRWDPWPPREWLEPRKKWSKFVRGVLKHSRTWDSEKQVRDAHPDSEELAEWLAVRDTFEPNTTPVWLDDSVLKFCAEWAERERGIVWTGHVTFGERLEKDFGLCYYGKRGRDARGRMIEDHPVGTPLVASIASNSEGRNLQAWSTSLITSPPPNGKGFEQLLGRMHREGQEADEVKFDVICNAAEHVGAVWQAVSDCRYVQDTTGAPQKILLAGLNIPTADEIVFRTGPRWNRGRGEKED
jgi:hypothetical protein